MANFSLAMGIGITESKAKAFTKLEGVKYNAAMDADFFKKPLLPSCEVQGFISVGLM